jgi:predicted amidohydrolase
MRKILRAAIYQYRCRNETPAAKIARLDHLLRSQAGELDLVICPELYLSGYNVGEDIQRLAESQTGAFSNAMAALARKWEIALIYGYPERLDSKVFNSAICIDSKGAIIAHYRKLRLPKNFEQANFSTGNAYCLFKLSGWCVAILICYDVEFPEAVRACASRGAELIVAPTALKQEWAFVARNMVPTRAFENGVFVAYANYCGSENGFNYLGESCFASPSGILTVAADKEILLKADLDWAEIETSRRALTYLDDYKTFEQVL